MGFTLLNNEPMVILNNMDSYFKQKPPDCVLVSKEFFKVPIHKELFCQTEFMRSMIKSAGFENCCSSIEIICPSLCKDELEGIIQFLYNGNVSADHQNFSSQISSHLVTLFGFSPMKIQEIPKIEMNEESKIDMEDELDIEIDDKTTFEFQEKFEVKTEEEPKLETENKSTGKIEETPMKIIEDSRPRKRSRKQSFGTNLIRNEEPDIYDEIGKTTDKVSF